MSNPIKLSVPIRAYKLQLVEKDGVLHRINSLDIHIKEDYRKYSNIVYPVILEKPEMRIIRNRKHVIRTKFLVPLYLHIKSITKNGVYGILFQTKILKKSIGSSYSNKLSYGIKYGFWDIYRVARVFTPYEPTLIIYFNRWWEND
jgi:hypothetical protein